MPPKQHWCGRVDAPAPCLESFLRLLGGDVEPGRDVRRRTAIIRGDERCGRRAGEDLQVVEVPGVVGAVRACREPETELHVLVRKGREVDPARRPAPRE